MKYCFCVQFVLFWSINFDVQWEDRWNHTLFWYVIQGTCGFHLCFHWIWKLMNLAIFNWLSKLWIISDFWNAYFSCFSLKLLLCSTQSSFINGGYRFKIFRVFLRVNICDLSQDLRILSSSPALTKQLNLFHADPGFSFR